MSALDLDQLSEYQMETTMSMVWISLQLMVFCVQLQ